MFAQDDTMDVGAAKWDFVDYCNGRPGVKEADILKNKTGDVNTVRYWVDALFLAKQQFAMWASE